MFTSDAFSRFLQRASVQPHAWLDLREAFDIERYYSPLSEFCLFSRWHGENVERGLALLDVSGSFVCTERLSTQPIHDCFVAALRFDASPSGEDGEVCAKAFVARELARSAESYLCECYGMDRRDDHEVFRFMDFPGFDQGSAAIGFGLLIERDRKTRWLWSRIVFAHK